MLAKSAISYIPIINIAKVFFTVIKLPNSNCVTTKVYNNTYTLDTCGGRIEAANGTITSPSFPETYPGNKSCTWEIIAPPQYKITLNFTHFDLEGNNVRKLYI